MASASAKSAEAANQAYQNVLSRYNNMIYRSQQMQGAYAQKSWADQQKAERKQRRMTAKEEEEALRMHHGMSADIGNKFGPWGYLVGGVLGTAAEMNARKDAAKAKGKKGYSWADAFKDTHGRLPSKTEAFKMAGAGGSALQAFMDKDKKEQDWTKRNEGMTETLEQEEAADAWMDQQNRMAGMKPRTGPDKLPAPTGLREERNAGEEVYGDTQLDEDLSGPYTGGYLDNLGLPRKRPTR